VEDSLKLQVGDWIVWHGYEMPIRKRVVRLVRLARFYKDRGPITGGPSTHSPRNSQFKCHRVTDVLPARKPPKTTRRTPSTASGQNSTS